MTVHALRRRVGRLAFFAILKRWTSEHRHGSSTAGQFRTGRNGLGSP